MTDAIRVEIRDRDEFEKLTDYGTLYRRNNEDVIATVVGGSEQRIDFYYIK